MRRIIYLLLLFPLPALSQQLLDSISGYCSYTNDSLQDEIYAFTSDRKAKEQVAQIVRYTGLTQNFRIVAANVPNAIAFTRRGERYIAYNQTFMLRLLKASKTDWAAVSVWSHEIGHHLSGHTLRLRQHNPGDELTADRFSGFIMYRMGASLDQALSALNTIGKQLDSTESHPPLSARLAAVTNGWLDAKDMDQPANLDLYKPGTDTLSPFLFTCKFKGDDNLYFINERDEIIWFDNRGSPIIIGYKTNTESTSFKWMYRTGDQVYGVDERNRLWSITSYGSRFISGRVLPYSDDNR